MKKINIDLYTDGSATTVDKPGGWAWVMVIDGVDHSEHSGHMPKASNNDAELEAAIQGLTAVRAYITHYLPVVPDSTTVTLVSDSQLVLGWTNGTYAFRQKEKMDKFKNLQLLANLMNVKTRWVEGHTGEAHNERCDELANLARKNEPIFSIPVDIFTPTKPTKTHIYKTENSVTFTIRIKTNTESLRDFTGQALTWADNGPHVRSSNDWTTMFVDKLEELLENNKCFSIEKD